MTSSVIWSRLYIFMGWIWFIKIECIYMYVCVHMYFFQKVAQAQNCAKFLRLPCCRLIEKKNSELIFIWVLNYFYLILRDYYLKITYLTAAALKFKNKIICSLSVPHDLFWPDLPKSLAKRSQIPENPKVWSK